MQISRQKCDDSLNQSTKYSVAIHDRDIEEQMISTGDRGDRVKICRKVPT